MSDDANFDRYLEAIENDMRLVVPSTDQEMEALGTFYTMLRYHLGWVNPLGQLDTGDGGKRLRPLLCLLACEAAGGNYRAALPVASAIELLHNFTLIHDDIQDRSEERRHRATLWHIWGEAQAINAGDALYSLALLSLARLPALGIDASYVVTAMSELNRTLLVLAEGQYLDICFEQKANSSLGEYLSMIERKTAALIGASLWLGAFLPSHDQEISEHYRKFGHDIGVAFQIQDDVLGIWGDPRVTGKPSGDDILRRKKTLPLLFALERAQGAQQTRLVEIYESRQTSDNDVDEVKSILERAGSREFAQGQVEEWYHSSLLHLDAAEPAPEAGQKLRALASTLLKRSR